MHDLRALVVDDSKVGRITMMRKLEPLGIRVDLAESGEEALDYLARARPDVIFMDHMMPDLDGFEVTRRIKAAPATRDIPVIIVSGNDEAAFLEEARQAGALDAIAKPPADDVLARLLASLPVSAAALAEAPRVEGLTEAQARCLVQDLLQEMEARVRADFQAGLEGLREHQESALARLREQEAIAVAPLNGRLQALEQRVRALTDEIAEVARAAAAAADVHGLGAALESRLDDRLARQAEALTDLERRMPDLSPMENRLAEMGHGVQTLEAEVARLLSDQDALRVGLEQRIAQAEALASGSDAGSRIGVPRQSLLGRPDEQGGQMHDRVAALDARFEGLTAEVRRLATGLDDARAATCETGVLQAELAELRERLSDANLRRLMADAQPDVLPEARPAAVDTGRLVAEVGRLENRLRRHAMLTLAGGVLLLGAVVLLMLS